jgi:hypothetical protein
MSPKLQSTRPPAGAVKLASAVALGLLLTLLPACGANKKDAQSLAKAGIASSDRVAKYYDSLVQANTKYLRILSYTVAPKLTKSEKKELELERRAYASRADLAHKLNAAYMALGQLIDFDAAADIKGSVSDLTTAVLAQVPHPKDLDSDLFKSVIGKIAGRLIEMQQEKEFRRNAPRVLEVLDGVGEIFERERPLYVQTVQLYEDEASKLAQDSLGTGRCGTALATGIPMIEDLFEPYKVKLFLTPETDPGVCKKNRDYFFAQIGEVARERKEAARHEARGISTALYNLERTHRTFLREKPAAPSLLPVDLTGTDRLVSALREALAARTLWEKQEQERKKREQELRERELEQGREPPADAGDDAEEPEYVPQKGFVADYVAGLLSPIVKKALAEGGDTSSNAFRRMLLDDLNRIIETGNIFEGILLKDGREALEKYRNSTVARERPGLRNALLRTVSGTLTSDRAMYSGAAAGPLPDRVRNLVVADPAAKPLAFLNRAILSYVFADSIAPAMAA